MSRILESDDSGDLTIPADLLDEPAPHTPYVVEKNAKGVLVMPRVCTAEGKQTAAEWLATWRKLAVEIDAASITDRSAVEMLSEMRR